MKACPECGSASLVTTCSCADCGCVLKEGKPRSTDQHRRQFAIFNKAWHHWPSLRHEFEPRNENHLRYWLTMQAGHFEVKMNLRIDSADPDKIAWLLTWTAQEFAVDYMFIDLKGNLLTVKKVNSISYAELTHEAACKLFDEIANVLHEVGLNAEELLRERVV